MSKKTIAGILWFYFRHRQLLFPFCFKFKKAMNEKNIGLRITALPLLKSWIVLQAIFGFISDIVAFIFDLLLKKRVWLHFLFSFCFQMFRKNNKPLWVQGICPTLGAWWSDRYQRHIHPGRAGCSALKPTTGHEWGTVRVVTLSCIQSRQFKFYFEWTFQLITCRGGDRPSRKISIWRH